MSLSESESLLFRNLIGRLMSGEELPECDAFAELLADFPAVLAGVRSQLRGRFAAAGRDNPDDDHIGDALGFLVVLLERGESLGLAIWRAASWVAEGRRFVSGNDYSELLGCVTVWHDIAVGSKYHRNAKPGRFVFSLSSDERALALAADPSQLEPWQQVAIAEERERSANRRPGSEILGEWLAGVYSEEFGALDWFSSDPQPTSAAELLALVGA